MRFLSTLVLGLLCLGLAATLFVSMQNNEGRHEKDAEAITRASDLLSSSQAEVADFIAKVVTLSNRLESCQSAALTLSNKFIEAKSVPAAGKESPDPQISDLKQQITRQSMQLESEKQASTQRIAVLTHQLAELTNQLASAQASLLKANKEYALLDNRFRRDVAERVIVERKFNNTKELQAQLEYLHWNAGREISEDQIRQGLNVVVGKSNLCYVIAPE